MKIFCTHSSFAYLLNIIKFIQKCSCLRSCSNTVRILLVAVIIQVLPISLSPWMKRLQSNIISNMQYRSLFITHAVYANIFDKILLILLWEKMLVFAKASSYWESKYPENVFVYVMMTVYQVQIRFVWKFIESVYN